VTDTKRIETTIAYVGGGSLNWARVLMADLIHDGTISAEIRLYDLDVAAARRNADLGNRYSQAHNVSIRYVVADTLQAALTGTEFVVISILPGTFDDMANDLDLPAREGILQSVGDTVGPGGFVRSMRAIPAMVDIAEAIRIHCPRAYVCNLTNPMSVLTGALYATFPEIRAWGECHEVTKLKHLIARFANAHQHVVPVTYDQVDINVLGINHFTFVDAAVVAGRDWLPDYVEFARTNRGKGWRETPLDLDNEEERSFEDANRVKLDLTARLGIAAAAGDRHLAEFLPANWYLNDATSWEFGLTSVDWRRRNRVALQQADQAAEERNILPELAGPSEEALVSQIRALSCGETFIVNANLPNRGQVDGLPLGAIVETNAVFSGTGIRPVFAGRLPLAAEAIVRPHAERQNALLQSVLKGDLPALESLFLTDPLVAAIGPERGTRLFRSMVAATSRCLPASLRLSVGS
jgi:alpha-galactosidase/6-phospho-beta-glucosidase family protein